MSCISELPPCARTPRQGLLRRPVPDHGNSGDQDSEDTQPQEASCGSEIVTSKGSDYNQGKGSIYMVMEFLEHDLTGLTDAGQKFTVPQIKCYMKQLLEGLCYCHQQKVLHRDIKGSNLLISNDGHLKLADFGLARPFDTDQQRPYTNRVITLWYRPPELLLGATMYGPAIDMWSAGCIFAELLLRKPILPGKNEFEQIDLIFKLLGTPDETTWPKCSKLQYYDMILSQNGHRKYTSRFDEKFAHLDNNAKDLLRKLLHMDPEKRITASDALDHDYFWSDPVPATPEMLPKYPPSHEFTAKKRRQQSQQQQAAAAAQQQQQQQVPPGHLPVSGGGPHHHQGYNNGGHPPPHMAYPHQNSNGAANYGGQHPPNPYHNGGNGGNGGHHGNHSSNPYYAAAQQRGGPPPGPHYNSLGAGPPPPGHGNGGGMKRYREGPPGGGHAGFFDPAQQQQQPGPNGNGHRPGGGHGYPGGGWPSGGPR